MSQSKQSRMTRFVIYTFELVYHIIDSIIKRVLRGAKRPTWWLTTELSRKTTRRTLDHSLGWGMQWYRNLQRISASAVRNDADVFSSIIRLDDCTMEWFGQGLKKQEKAILYFHGGGYVYGSTDTHRSFINRLVKQTGTDVYSVNYRLAPENPFPAAVEDAVCAYDYVLKQISNDKIILMGDSAGGVLCTAIMCQTDKLPIAAVLISPWVEPLAQGGTILTNDEYDIGGQPFLLDCANKYLQGQDENSPLITPKYIDMSGFPPLLIQVGQCEVLLSQIQEFVQKAKSENASITYTEYEDMFHSFLISNPNIPQSEAAMKEIAMYVKNTLDKDID